MATRHEITSIQFKADAGKANAALDSIRQKAKEANEQMTQLRQKLEEGKKANLPTEQIQQMEAELDKATKAAKQWGDAQKNLMRGVKALDQAIIEFNKGQGSVEKMSAALSKAARNAAQLQQSRMERGSEGWHEMEALILALDKNLLKARQDFDGLVQTIQSGGQVSVSELTSAKATLKELSDLTAFGSEEWKQYKSQLDTVSNRLASIGETERRLAGEVVTVNDAIKMSAALSKEAAEIRAAAAKEHLDNERKELTTIQENLELSKKKIATTEHELAATKEKMAAQQELVGSIRALEDAEDKAEAKTSAAETALRQARGEQQKFGDAAWEAAKKVGELEKKLEELNKEPVKPKVDTSKIEMLQERLRINKSYMKLEESNIARNRRYYDDAVKALNKMGLSEQDITNQAKIQEAVEKKTLEILQAEVEAEKDAANQRRQLVSKITSSQLGGNKAEQEFYKKNVGNYDLGQYGSIDEMTDRISHLEMVSKLKNGKRFSDDTYWDPDDELDDDAYIMTDEERQAAINELRVLKQHIREELLKALNIEGDIDKALNEITGGDGFSEESDFGRKLNDKIDAIKEKIEEKIETSLDQYTDIIDGQFNSAYDNNGKLNKEKVKENVADYIRDNVNEATGSTQNIEESKRIIQEYTAEIEQLEGKLKELSNTEQQSVDVDKQKSEIQQQLADAQQKLSDAKQAAEEPTRKLKEAEKNLADAQSEEKQATEALTKARGNMNVADEEQKLDALERQHDDLTESLSKQKQAETELAQAAVDARQNEKEAAIELAQAQNVTQEQLENAIAVLEKQQKKTADGTEEYDQQAESLTRLRERLAEMKGEVMSLADAEELATTAGKEGFKGTATQLQKAESALQRAYQTAQKGSPEWEKYRAALERVRMEMQNMGMTSERMHEILDNPAAARNLNELRDAVKRAKAELALMEDTVGDASEEYENLAKQTKNAEIAQKQLEAQSKGTASAFDKAWSRLKTYVTLYVGAAVAMQKLVSTMGDLMELSDKMGEVRKTTGFSADEVGRLSDNLAKLDTRTSLVSLMEISSSAGTLGLKTMEDVEGFTEAANKLMVALPEMGHEAATEMMRVALATGEINKIRKQIDEGAIEGSSATAVAMEKIGSTIDRLRASSAATAPAITDFVKRVGAVGSQSNISIDQIAALGSTISALGMRTEMSATALSRMIPAIKNNAFEVARAIGMAPETLRAMFDEAGGGMNAMLAIFQHIKDQGMDEDNIEKMLGMGGMADVMKDLNQQGARAGIVFASLSQNVDVLREHLGVAKTAYEEGVAIQEEYERMNETTAAKWERLKNTVEEFFVKDSWQDTLGWIIDRLRYLVDLMAGPLNDALLAVSVAFGSIKLGLTSLPEQGGKFLDYLKDSAKKASEALEEAANSTDKIGNAAKGVEGAADAVEDIGDALGDAQEAGEKAGDAMESATGAIKGMTGATKVSIFSVKGLKAAWKGLDTTMKTNIIVAAAAILYTIVKAVYNWRTEVNKASKALGEANAMINIAIDRFEGYWNKLKDTATALDDAKKKTNGLKEGSEQLTKATIEVTKADNAHRAAIADINGVYGKYLGFMLTEANYANLSAAAHDKVAAAIRREMLAKQEQAAIDKVTQEHTEKLKDDLSNLSEELRENNRLNNQQAAQAKNELQKFLRENIKYDANGSNYTVKSSAVKRLQSQGYDLSNASTQEIIAVWFNQYLKDSFHLDQYARRDITGITETGNKGWGLFKGGTNLRGDYANTYLDYIKEVAETQNVFAGDIADAEEKDRESTVALVKKLQKEAQKAQAKITNKSTSEKDRNKAYEELANALEGLDGSIDKLNPIGNKNLITSIQKQAEQIANSVDKEKLLRARTNAKSIFSRVTEGSSGDVPTIPIEPEKNPWGEKLPAESTDWKNMAADALVQRRKQMNEFVNAIQTDSDIKTVLKEDSALRKAIENGMSSDMRTVIEWYNTERLKIQDELHARHLTNTGDWMDPKKGRKRASKLVQDEIKYYLDELDAYYTERKAKIQEAQNDGEISEAESWRRTLQNEAEWQQRRAELQELYTKRSVNVTKEERDAIYDIISERTGDTISYIKSDIANTVKFIEKIGVEKGKPAMDRIYGDIELNVERSFLRQRNAVGKQMDAIRDIIEKERPFNGITENLEQNLTKMGVLYGDMDDELERLRKAGEDVSEFNAKQREEGLRRMAFLLQEAEHAYNTNIEEVMQRMAEKEMTVWAEYLRKSPKAQDALMAQLHTTFDKVQEAIKKEASLWKKEAENMWNNILLPDGQTTLKQLADRTVAALSLDESRTKRANSLINAGQASERVADRLAIQQMKVQLAMQEHYYNIMRQRGQATIDDMERQAAAARERHDIEAATRFELDAQHARMTLNLATTKEETELAKQREEIIARTEESQNRLYTELKAWADLISSSLQNVFEASHAGDAEYYNERAKLNLTGKGGPGAGTYIVIENEGTSDASAHYEYLNEREALERQREIENQNALAEAWRKLMDDINMKLSETITDQLNAMLQNQSIDANTQAVLANTEALYETAGGSGRTAAYGETKNEGRWTKNEGTVADGLSPMEPPVQEPGADYMAPWTEWAEKSNKATETMVGNNKKVEQSTQSAFARMTMAANMYGIAYQAMSNENLNTTQKFSMMALQAVGNYAIGALTAEMASASAKAATDSPGVLGTLWKQLGWAAAPVFAIFTGLLGGLMGLATSKITKAKGQIAQVTGAGHVSAGRLSTGMLQYAEGNVNEFTDPSSLREGQTYQVDAANGKTYKARYMGKGAKTHITNGPEFHLVGEEGREAIIDAKTTRHIRFNEPEVWRYIQTLYNGGSLSHLPRRRGRGVAAFADGNLDEMGSGGTAAYGESGLSPEQVMAMQASLDRNSEVLERALSEGIKGVFDVYGKGGLVDSYDTGKKTVKRHGERY